VNDEMKTMWKRSWPNLWYYSGMSGRTEEKHDKPQDSRSDRDLNRGPPEYEGLLTTRQRNSVSQLIQHVNVMLYEWLSTRP
jgi:hypothetical protein